MENQEIQNGAVENTESKTYTQEEVDKLLQAETDRRVNMALRKQEAKNAEKVKEAQKLSAMDAEQRYEYQLQQREAAIAEKERQLTLAENKTAASKILAERGLDLSLVDLIVTDDAESMNTNIQLLDKAFKKSVKNEVEKRLASNAPKQTLDVNKTYTKADIAKMSLGQLQELYKTQPELFE